MAVDVDAERDRERVRQWHIGLSERMPDVSTRQLRNLLRSRFEMLCLAPIPSDIERHIVRSARGRPGWIERCAELAREPRYWRDDRLFATLLCIDSEIALRGTIDRQFGPNLVDAVERRGALGNENRSAASYRMRAVRDRVPPLGPTGGILIRLEIGSWLQHIH
jgi:hypothetical protein